MKKASIAELQNQINDLTEALQHERADSENIRRRHEEQVAGLKNMIKASVVRDLLPVIDNFERSLKHLPANSRQLTADSKDNKLDDWLKGVLSIKAQFDQTLEKMGVERIKTKGEVFDPKFHEAISMEDGDGTTEVVSEELQAGYCLGNEVIRHASVKVKMENRK